MSINPLPSLSASDIDRLLTACRASASPDLYPVVVLALATGARRLEIMLLRWPAVNLTDQTVTITDAHSGAPRTAHLDALALAILTERFQVRRDDTDLVFPAPAANPLAIRYGGSLRNGRKVEGLPRPQDGQVYPVDLRPAWATAIKSAAMPGISWLNLRMTAAYLARTGGTLRD